MLVRHKDGTAHFSHVKRISDSPATYKKGVEVEVEVTKAMRIGTGTHFLMLGPRKGAAVVKVPFNDRRAVKWKTFVQEYEAHLENKSTDVTFLSLEEWQLCEELAEAIRADPVVRDRGYFDPANSAYEVPLTWEDAGIKCSTSGVDLVGIEWGWGELKTTTTTKPEVWMRHAERMYYHAQIAWYERALRANGKTYTKPPVIIGVETAPAHNVVVLECQRSIVELGHKEVTLWLERLRACELEDHWPGYVQAPVPWEARSFGSEEDGFDEEGAAA
jgi:hypothetical protein